MKRVWRSLCFGLEGWWHVIRTQWNMRFHLVVGALALVMSAWLRVTKIEWILILVVIALVLSAECINTGIERLADRVNLDEDPLIKNCKDAAAGGVLVMSTLSVIVGAAIFAPHLIEVLRP